MTDPERPSQSDFVLIALQLNAAQASATTLEAREAADADMSHFLRMAHAGRLDEWKASRGTYDDVARTVGLDEGPIPQHAPTNEKD